MKKLFLLLSVLPLLPLAAGNTLERPFKGDARPPRKISISRTSFITVRLGEEVVIVVAPGSAAGVRHAASELGRYLKKLLNVKVSFVSRPSSGEKITFFIGESEYSRQAGLRSSVLSRDGFIIKCTGRRIYILGKDAPVNVQRTDSGERGTLFGVYDFLERFCGIRFYFYDDRYIHIPSVKELSIPEAEIFERPDFEFRRVQIYEGVHGNEKSFQEKIPGRIKWSNMLRMQTRDVPNCHGLSVLNYIERFGETHPEYFSLLSNGRRHNDPAIPHPGQLCFSSGIRNEIYLDAKACLTGQKAASRGIRSKYKGVDWPNRHQKGYLFNIMPQDGMVACRCAACGPIFQQPTEQAASDFIWQFVAEVGFRLKKENVPGFLSMMTYHYYRHVPRVKLPDNLVVMFAIHGPWAMHTPNYPKDHQRLLEWNRKLNDKVYLWTYVNKHSALRMPGIPHSTPLAIGKFFKALRNDIHGAFLESETDFTIFNMLNYYVFAKTAWNGETDTDALLNEFYHNMFGKAAPHIKEFFTILENKWISQIAGRVIETPAGPSSIPPSDYDLWNKIYPASVQKHLDQLLNKAESAVASGSAEAGHIAAVRKDFLDPVIAACKTYNTRNATVAGQKFYFGSAPGKVLYLSPWRRQGNGNGRAAVRTGVQLWQSGTELCIRFQCEEPRMGDIVAQRRKKDDREIWMDNCVEVFLNPSGDRKTYYQILVNSAGAFTDQKTVKKGSAGHLDYTWDSGLKVNIRKQKTSWSAELRIPLRNLPDLKKEFPANFTRSRVLKNSKNHEVHYQSSRFARNFHDLENYGTFIRGEEPENLLINGDFSMKPTRSKRHFGIWKENRWQGGWIAEMNKFKNKIEIDPEEKISSPYAVRLEGENPMLLQFLPKLKPDTKYRLSFYVKLENVRQLKRGGGACVNIMDDTNRWFPAHNFLTGSSPWIYQSFEFTSRPNTNKKYKSYIRLRLLNAEGSVRFDDVRLEEL